MDTPLTLPLDNCMQTLNPALITHPKWDLHWGLFFGLTKKDIFYIHDICHLATLWNKYHLFDINFIFDRCDQSWDVVKYEWNLEVFTDTYDKIKNVPVRNY